MKDPRLEALLAAAVNPTLIRRARLHATKQYPPFPSKGCAAFLSEFLKENALPTLLFTTSAQELAGSLERRGWDRVHNPEPGDVAVCDDLNHNGNSDHVFLFMGWEDGNPRALDNQDTKVHTRGPGKTRVHYYLRGGWSNPAP
jgi:hypothetical protein